MEDFDAILAYIRSRDMLYFSDVIPVDTDGSVTLYNSKLDAELDANLLSC